MARQINKPVVVVFSLFVFASAIVASAIAFRRVQQRDPQHFVQLAKEARDRQEWKQAALFFYKAWERSSDPELLVSYGQMALSEGDLRAAVDAWRKALIADTACVSAHRELLHLLTELARLEGSVANWRTVQETAEGFLKVDASRRSTPDEAFARHALGLALLNIEGVREGPGVQRGLAELEAAARLAPENPLYAIDHAAQLGRTGKAAQGDEIFAELMARFTTPGEDAVRVRVAYARNLAAPSRRAYEESENLFRDALTLAGEDPASVRDAKLGYAALLAQKWARAVQSGQGEGAGKEFEHAVALLNECIQAEPDIYEPFVQLAILYSAAEKHAAVVETAEKRLSRPLERKGLEATRNRVGAFNLMVLASDACVALAVDAGAASDKREAWLARADQFVASARGEFPTHPRVAAQSGKVKLARGNDRGALEDLREADKGYRTYGTIDWQNKILLARLHVKLGEPGAARGVLEDVAEFARIQRPNDSAFWLLYGQVLLMHDEADRALAVAERVLDFDAANFEAKQLKAAVLERKGRLTEAGQLFEEAGGPGVVRALLEFRERERAGRTDEALAGLLEALKESPSHPRLLGAAVLKLIELHRPAEAEALVSEALAKNPDDPALRRLAAFARPGLSEEQRDAAMKEAITSEPDAFQRSLQMAAFAMQRTDWNEALRRFNDAERHLLQKDTPMARQASSTVHRDLLTQKLRVAAELKDDAAMRDARDAAAKFDVDGAGGKALLGVYHLLRNETEPAIGAFRAAVAAQPTDAETLAYLGHALAATGKNDDARTFFERSVRANPNEFLAHRGLAVLAQQQGDAETLDAQFSICRKLAPNDPWVRAEELARKEQADPNAAIARREAMLAGQPDDADNVRRLAWLCETIKDFQRADRYYARLRELRPDDEAAALTLAKYYRRTDRPDRALEVLNEYARTRSTPRQKANAAILVAGHYLNQNNLKQAEVTLLEAAATEKTLEVLQSLGEFYVRTGDRPDEALKWYDAAIAEAKASNSDRLPSLITGRIVCLLNPRINDVPAARRAVDELRRTHPADLGGLYWDSEVHARQGDMDRAVAVLTEYLDRSPDDAYALLQRARMLLSLGRTTQAVADLELVKRTQPLALELEPRILLARIHSRSGRENAALLELELLVKDAPQSVRANEELIRAYLRNKRFADAERTATAQINRAGDNPDSRWLFLRGRALVELGNVGGGLADARRGWELSGSKPESFWNVLDLYRRAGRFAEGAEFYRRQAASGSAPPQVQSLCAVLLARAGRTAEAVEQFRLAMDAAVHDSFAAVRAVQSDLASAMTLEQALAHFEAPPSDARLARANDRILSQLYRREKRLDESARRLETLIASARDDAERAGLWYELGEMHQLAGNAARSKTAYEETLKYDPRNWTALNNLAFLLAEQTGENEAALAYARRAVSIMDTADTVDTLGWILVTMGNHAGGIAELSRAVRLDPTQPLILYHLGEAYRRAGRFLEAGDILQRAVESARSAGDAENEKAATDALEKTTRRDKSAGA